ncbi:MAG: glucosaminidase domain-containing protein [Bacteroidota bacterium]
MTRTSIFLISLLCLLLEYNPLNAQGPSGKISYTEYIQTYKDIAILKMKEYKIPASITLAQGLLESGSGNSELALNANNHFGIKCHKEWTGMTYTMDDDEKNECFRKYASAEESYNDHSFFLTTRSRYASLFELDIRDYKGWAYGLKSAGYATNPRYAEMLIKFIEENELYLFDSEAKGLFTQKETNQKSVLHERSAVEYTGTKIKSFQFLEVAEGNRKIYINNNVRLIYARQGDSPQTIAHDLGLHVFLVLQYNELGKNEPIKAGQIIYIEPKKRKASSETHNFTKGETMRDVSQLYGLKLKALYKKNGLPEGHEPSPGTTLYLRKSKPD